jgi:hypothetical protein
MITILAGLLKMQLVGSRWSYQGIWIVALDEEYLLIGGKFGLYFCAVDSFLSWWFSVIVDI